MEDALRFRSSPNTPGGQTEPITLILVEIADRFKPPVSQDGYVPVNDFKEVNASRWNEAFHGLRATRLSQ
jgi:hypothetical protein